MLRGVGRMMGKGTANPTEVARYLNLFSYDRNFDLVKDADGSDVWAGCDSVKAFPTPAPCNSSAGCSKYCDFLARMGGSSSAEAAVLEAMDLSVRDVNGALDAEAGVVKSFLPACSWKPDGKCWFRVITDRGLCFTNYDRGTELVAFAERRLELNKQHFPLENDIIMNATGPESRMYFLVDADKETNKLQFRYLKDT